MSSVDTGRVVHEAEDQKQQQPPYTPSVQEALHEAMNTWQGPGPAVQSPRDLPAPEPHLPLRKASAQRLADRRHAPRPLFAPSHHHVRGFNPSPVEPLPHIDNVTASNEHAFAGRDVRRPSKLPLGSLVMKQGQSGQHALQTDRLSSSLTAADDSIMPASPLLPPTPNASMQKTKRLRPSRSFGEGLRGLKQRLSSHHKGMTDDGRHTPESVPPTPSLPTNDIRTSFRSALTSHSSYLNSSSVNTDRSSQGTGNTSHSDFVHVYPSWPDTQEGRGSMTVDDAIGMYEEGFESVKQSFDTHGKRSLQTERPLSQPSSLREVQTKRPNKWHRRSQSASMLEKAWTPTGASLAPPPMDAQYRPTSADIATGTGLRHSQDERPASKPSEANAVPRDRYGFKKASHYITVEQFDAWNAQYSVHLERRSRKWHTLMHSYGLDTDKPFRFPPKSDKIKRYVRKGVPPELRGAAWFWYAGGPHQLAKEPGLYWELLEQIEHGKLDDNDREHIERDLNRTFPDNVRFKPDPTTMTDAQAGAGGGNAPVVATGKTKKRRSAAVADPETPILRALRRVLQAFAVHNPQIGYCQSLNFIAGLLLLFLDSDEEKAFTLLEIVTSTHLPGTHGVALEGANIDIAVLMSCIKDSLPSVWAKLDDKGGGIMTGDTTAQTLRLPTVSLATTAWFMSLFVGTLPIEAVLRVWDCLFFEGSKTLFRIALAIFKAGEKQILAVNDPMEIFQVVQTIPRSMLDVNGLMEVCFRRRGGFGHVSQELIERRREERRRDVRVGVAARLEEGGDAGGVGLGIGRLRGRWRSKTKG